MPTIDYMFNSFQITNEEYAELEKELGKYCYFIAQKLKRNNIGNNMIEDVEDITQDLRWSISRAGVYTKRQTYLISCMEISRNYVTDPTVLLVLDELNNLWKNRTRHGANKQKFGEYQEWIIDRIVSKYVPQSARPDKNRKLVIDKSLSAYCKTVAWNCSKNLGKKITRERNIRSGQVSLSEHGFLDGMD